MSQTDGWDIIKNRLQEEAKDFTDALLATPVIPENLPQLARLQAQVNGALYVLDMVADYINPQESE